jgi:hypothetical protein
MPLAPRPVIYAQHAWRRNGRGNHPTAQLT